MQVILPLHPRTRKILDEKKVNLKFPVIEPVGYFDMLRLIQHCRLVMTDSGGLQKEAYFFGKYCITLRDDTEWMELVDGGYNHLAGSSKGKIIFSFHQLLAKKGSFAEKFFGCGKAASRIVEHLADQA